MCNSSSVTWSVRHNLAVTYHYIYIYIYIYIPVVPHKAVAEVSKIGNL